jgi:hypothetical protein
MGGGSIHFHLFYWVLWADIATFCEEAKVIHQGITKFSSVYKKNKVMSSCAVKLLF